MAVRTKTKMGQAVAQDPASATDAKKIGFDFGTNTSVVTGFDGKGPEKLIHTVVGYPKPGLLPGILPEGKTILFGDEAIRYRLHLQLKWPLDKGIVKDLDAARDFARHVREELATDGEIWAVVGGPANASAEAQRDLRLALSETFQKLIVVPEPFLAAMGMRDESRLADASYVDPTRNSLVVDIGAGTTDFCMVQGFYPGANDQVSADYAGNDIDKELHKSIRRRYPDANISGVSITRLKEENSYVGDAPGTIEVTVPVSGKPRRLDITEAVAAACETLLPILVKNIATLVDRCDPDAVETMLGNVLLTGGGSLIRNLAPMLQGLLHEEGYEAARVAKVPNYKKLVARGAAKTAGAVRDDQWQITV